MVLFAAQKIGSLSHLLIFFSFMVPALVTLLERLSVPQGCKLVLTSLLLLHLWSKSGNWIEAVVTNSEHHTALLFDYYGQNAA